MENTWGDSVGISEGNGAVCFEKMSDLSSGNKHIGEMSTGITYRYDGIFLPLARTCARTHTEREWVQSEFDVWLI